MCLKGNENAILTAVEELRDAREMLHKWGDNCHNMNAWVSLDVTEAEAYDILQGRLKRAEEKCRALGVHGPTAKADPAETQFMLHAK